MTAEATTPAHPAATVILLRDAAGRLETLLLRRNSKLAFHGGAWVFPGGRIDPEDYAADPTDDLTAARRAAAREAQEEAGLLVVPEDLLFLAHWTTPEGRPHRYATWFFVGAASDAAVRVDGGEIHAHRWMQPQQALAAQRSGNIELPPPTFVTLLQLAAYDAVDEALRHIAARPPERFLPRFVQVSGGACSVYEEDAAYATGDLEHPGPRHRLWMLASGWRYERSG